MSYERLLQLPLMLNPVLDATPRLRRASAAEEAEMLRWAEHGITRVAHVLDASGRRVATLDQLLQRHPDLVAAAYPRGRATIAHALMVKNLRRWKSTLEQGPAERVREGEFRWGGEGEVLQARQCGTRATSPA